MYELKEECARIDGQIETITAAMLHHKEQHQVKMSALQACITELDSLYFPWRETIEPIEFDA